MTEDATRWLAEQTFTRCGRRNPRRTVQAVHCDAIWWAFPGETKCWLCGEEATLYYPRLFEEGDEECS